MRLINANGLRGALAEAGLLTPKIAEIIGQQKVYATTKTHFPVIPLRCGYLPKDTDRRVGDDGRHDWLCINEDGTLSYINMQCCEGTPDSYQFAPTYEDPEGERYCTCQAAYEYIEGDEDKPTPEEEEERLRRIVGMTAAEWRQKHGIELEGNADLRPGREGAEAPEALRLDYDGKDAGTDHADVW